MKLNEKIIQFADEIIAIRRDIHNHPELGYEEHRTSDLIAQKLTEWGADEVCRGLAGTGVVGVIHGNEDHGRAIGLRADIDALPMQEKNAFPHASQHAVKMHACGHDGHTAMLLAAARYLCENRDFKGTVYTIFQPAEEGLVGAGKMIQDGLFKKFSMEAVFGMHNWPGMPVGEFGVLKGPIMASSSYFHVDINGVGTHAAKPHLGKDPIMAMVQLAQALQTIITRNRDPLDPAVISITQLHAGSADNVVPDTAQLRGTLRTFSEKTLALAKERIEQISQDLCKAMQCEVQIHFHTNYPPTINHDAETEFSAEVLKCIVGEENVHQDVDPSMGGEDFALMLKERPGCYIWIGNGDGSHRMQGHGEGPCGLHSPFYDFNDENIVIGGTYWVELAKQWLAR